MNNDVSVEELNTLLRGQFMGIRSFEHYIQKVDDGEIKHHFQSIQQELKQNAQKIAERIQNLGGVPADDEGFSGSLHSFMHKIGTPDDAKQMIEDALKGMDQYGIHYSEELVKGDLDSESTQIVKDIIDDNRKHAEQLRQMLH